ncbi:MAG: ABC transporter ATP-binding protein [Fusobacteriaceae bacterium]|jgi:oligopeptide/dipeptide ABC transporter ATP-binding protein|nr:ABC transporter ATP-binding protein [Fusobacteriaceae bacterium]
MIESPKTDDTILCVSNLNISFQTKDGPVRAVEGLDLEVKKGEILALVGESGCGKSVTSLAIMGLIEYPGIVKASGIWLAGREISGETRDEIRKMRGTEMAMIFQDPLTSLNPLYTVGNQISEQFLAHNSALDRATAKKKSVEMIRKTGIPAAEAIYDYYPHQLSGGMRQRIMIAIALCCNPKLLIADEPTTALDVTIQAQILHLMKELIREFDASILFITHDLGVVAEMADRVAVMYTGRIVEQADVFTLFHKPAHPYTKGLLHSTIRMQKHGDKLDPIPGAVPSLKHLPKGCRFHPRCAQATEKCKENAPPPVTVERGHDCRCFYPNEKG